MENTYEDMLLPVTSVTSGDGQEAAPGLYGLPIQIVNVCFAGEQDRPEQGRYVH